MRVYKMPAVLAYGLGTEEFEFRVKEENTTLRRS